MKDIFQDTRKELHQGILACFRGVLAGDVSDQRLGKGSEAIEVDQQAGVAVVVEEDAALASATTTTYIPKRLLVLNGKAKLQSRKNQEWGAEIALEEMEKKLRPEKAAKKKGKEKQREKSEWQALEAYIGNQKDWECVSQVCSVGEGGEGDREDVCLLLLMLLPPLW